VWVWILVAVLGLVVLCGGGAIIGGVFIFKAATAPVDTTNEWIDDVRAGNTSAAQSDTCAGESASEFADYIEFYTGSITSHNMNNVDVTNNIATVSGTISGSEGTFPFSFGLVDDDGWKVCSVT
jgi:fumarate hydratase class II